MPDASIKGIDFVIKGNADSASNSIKKLIDRMNELNGTFKSSSGISRLSGAFQTMKKDISAALKPMQKLGAAFKRIVFYRAIRFAIKQVTEAFQVGLQNAYQFSKAVGYDLADSLDNIATKSLTMKNQMGAAFGGLIQAIEPIVLRLIALVTRAANAIAQLMAILGGKSKYLKAVDTMTEWGEAVGGAGAAAKEALKYLAPFDELNVLPDDKNSGGGGGGGVPDYSAMFEETDVPKALQDFVSDFKITVSDVLFDWSDLTGEQIAEKALAGLFALTGAGVGFILGGVPGAIVGSLIGLSLGLIADTIIFDHDGVLSRDEIAHSLQYVLNALAGGVVGFVVGGPGGAFIGASIGLGLSLVADIFDLKAEGANKNTAWLDQLTVALGVLAGGVIGFAVGGPAGALIGATIGLGVTAIIESFKFEKGSGAEMSGGTGRTGLDYFIVDVLGLPTNAQWQEWGENIWKHISNGISSGWHWLTDGFADIGTELYNIFIAPIVNTFNDFISAHPKIASFFGLSGESLSPNFSSSGSDTMSLDIEANVTSVKDSVPLGQKIIDGVKGLFGSTDKGASLSTDNKTISSVAKFTSRVSSFPTGGLINGNPFFSSVAKFTTRVSSFPTSGLINNNPFFSSVAKFVTRTNAFASGTTNSSGQPIFSSVAKFASRINALTGSLATDSGNPIFNSVAKFTSRNSENLNTTFNSNARFTEGDWASWLGYDDKTLSVNAKMKDPYWADGTPTMTVYAAMSYTNNPGYVMGGYAKEGGSYYGGAWHDIPQFASGGFLRHGSLMIAGESGAEVVGHIGGRTEVLNRSQLASTMYAAVKSAMSGIVFNVSAPSMATGTADDGANEDMLYRAFLRALNDSDVADRPIELDGNTLYSSMVNRNRQNTRLTGVNALA